MRSGVNGIGERRLSVARTTADWVVDDRRDAGCVGFFACALFASTARPVTCEAGRERFAPCRRDGLIGSSCRALPNGRTLLKLDDVLLVELEKADLGS